MSEVSQTRDPKNQDLEAHARRLEAIIESSHDAIIGCDLSGRINSWNPAARGLYGYRPDEAIGQSLDLLVEGDQAGEVLRLLGRMTGGERFESYETVHIRRDGSPVAVSISFSLLEVEDGAGDEAPISEASLIVHDMTASQHTEAALRQAHRELETLIGTVAHELRSPLFGARGLVQLVRQEIPERSQDLETYLERLETSLGFSDHLLDELAAIAESRLADRNPQVVESRRIAEELVLEWRAKEPARELSFEVAEDLPRLWCRPDTLRQILRQLLDNAVKFAADHPESHIEIGWQEAEDSLVALFVRDSGPGISRGEQSRVFDMFYRRHGPERQGPGLGLALVKKLSEAAGGAAWLESAVGRGSTFFFTLPSTPMRPSTRPYPDKRTP